MTKDDFYIIRNSITMMQLAKYHGFKIIKRGGSYFTLCPFHNDKNASMQIFEGYRGFFCRGCGTGGDVNKFTELYENLTPKEAGTMLSRRFNIKISESEEVSPEAAQRARRAVLEQQQELNHQREIKASLTKFGGLIRGYELIALTAEPFSEIWCYVQNELPVLKGKWEALFGEMRRVD
jgi:DNA primase